MVKSWLFTGFPGCAGALRLRQRLGSHLGSSNAGSRPVPGSGAGNVPFKIIRI
jgi:hypothetical protein